MSNKVEVDVDLEEWRWGCAYCPDFIYDSELHQHYCNVGDPEARRCEEIRQCY